MLIAKNNEKERSHLFRIVIWTATIVIIVVAAYFLIRSFGTNPLKGIWKYEDDNITLSIKNDKELTITFANLEQSRNVKLALDYELDKSEKVLVISAPTEAETEKILEGTDGNLSESVLDTAVQQFTTSFDYSIESQRLTLTDREYGEQMIFDKQ